MANFLGGETVKSAANKKLDDLTPRQIVEELDNHVVGQANAKRAVAIALRNRIRRQKLPPEIAQDILPKNILMIGSTGVGKTEIARRLARLSNSPFIKIEASKFTEVGYVGRDVESMIRELTEISVEMTKQSAFEKVSERAINNVEEKILEILFPVSNHYYENFESDSETEPSKVNNTREKLRERLRNGELEDKFIEIETLDRSNATIDFIGGQGMEEMGINFREMFGNILPTKSIKRRVSVAEAREFLHREEQETLVDSDHINRTAIKQVEEKGIIFLDEIDKIAGGNSKSSGPDISREGVQRDLLPIVEGTTINTRYGMVNTDHILFIAAGAFHVSKPSDLIPELQGRFPIRVELESLTEDDFKRILIQPKNALIKQYQALLNTEDIKLEFTDEALIALAEITVIVNKTTEDIGARRLHTLLEKLLDEISFLGNEIENKHQVIDLHYVQEKLGKIVKDDNLRQYIL